MGTASSSADDTGAHPATAAALIEDQRRCDMPPAGVKSKKRTRQYQHIKETEERRGRSAKVAKRIAAATTNKTRREKGETKKK